MSERDVLLARAMIIHHQGAVQMARHYHADRTVRNGYLGLMNVDIVADQTQEIALMRRVVAAYAGDANSVRVDPSMIHGMEGTQHGGHARGGNAAAPAADAGQPARAGTAATRVRGQPPPREKRRSGPLLNAKTAPGQTNAE